MPRPSGGAQRKNRCRGGKKQSDGTKRRLLSLTHKYTLYIIQETERKFNGKYKIFTNIHGYFLPADKKRGSLYRIPV
jgi:hypothetical protein